MKRREIPGGSRFITFSCNRRLPLFNNERICEAFLCAVDRARKKYPFELFAWVIMPEHIHMMMRPSDACPLKTPLASIKTSVGSVVVRRWRKLNAPILTRITDPDGTPRFWQHGGGFDRNVRDDEEFCKEIKYIHLNPVKRGLVTAPELWKWSSVRWWMGQREGEFPCDPPPGGYDKWSRWQGFK